MAATYDLVIRNGQIVDGSGGEPFAGDVAVSDGRIAAVGKVEGSGTEEIDAAGLMVTPGFIDVHTHYDGQAIWSQRLNPSSAHGVTTVVAGNCGVGFAPCRAGDRDLLVTTMEGVEDIPGVVMVEGLTWEWESFPEFLEALEKRPHDINLAAYIPHSALRVYVMGERGARREQATPEDIEKMVAIVGQAMQAGAIGFATSNIDLHRRSDGEHIPSYRVKQPELIAIAKEVARWGGVFEIASALTDGDDDEQAKRDFDNLHEIARESGVRLTFTIAQVDTAPYRLAKVIDWMTEANKEEGVHLGAQTFPRPVGMVLGLDISANPFMARESYKAIAHLPIDERVREMKKPEVRAKILGEESPEPILPLFRMARNFEQMFVMGTTPNYEPDRKNCLAEREKREGRSADEIAYDALLEDDGKGMLLVTLANYSFGNLEPVRDVMMRDGVVLGLGDGGAHYGLICDASFPTFVMTYWTRDRETRRLHLPEAIRALSAKPAALMGFSDRGQIAVGKRADLNIIDFDGLTLHRPIVTRDLPANGRRLNQTATGYRATIVNGRVIQRDGVPTGELPGKVIRGAGARAERVAEMAK
jgi:N-acyl-D-aspartate/D-glutamate deacylase